jgi:enoyl-CoA hydratase/carnithine racemase
MNRIELANYKPEHIKWEVSGKVAKITIERPGTKNALTLGSYNELRNLFRDKLPYATDIKAVVITGADGNFCSGGDFVDIASKLVKMTTIELLEFTRMSGSLIEAMRKCPQPIVAAIDGACTGAGAVIAAASDFRFGTPKTKLAFLFVKVGLTAADMGAMALLPRLIGLSRAQDLLFTGRIVGGEEAERIGFYNRLVEPAKLQDEAMTMAQSFANGPSFAHGVTKAMFIQEWNAGLTECIEAEAQAQAICMNTQDFHRAVAAFAKGEAPVFEGN